MIKYILLFLFVFTFFARSENYLEGIYYPGQTIIYEHLRPITGQTDSVMKVGLMDRTGELITQNIPFSFFTFDPPDNYTQYFIQCNMSFNIPSGFKQKDSIFYFKFWYKYRDPDSTAQFYILETKFASSVKLISPIDNSTETGLYPRFTWTPEPYSLASYFLEIDDDTTFKGNHIYYNTTDTTLTIKEKLSPNRKYYWRVGSFFGVRVLDNSKTYSFTTGIDSLWNMSEIQSNGSIIDYTSDDQGNLLFATLTGGIIRKISGNKEATTVFSVVDMEFIVGISNVKDGHVAALMLDGNIEKGQILLSGDAGVTWTKGLQFSFFDLGIALKSTNLLLDDKNRLVFNAEDTLYAVSDYGIGEITTKIGFGKGRNVRHLIQNEDGRYFAVLEKTGEPYDYIPALFYSNDAVNWQDMSKSIPNDMIINTVHYNDGRIYIGGGDKDRKGFVCTSSDEGNTWDISKRWEQREVIGIASTFDGELFILTKNLSDMIFSSFDYGMTWTAIKYNLPGGEKRNMKKFSEANIFVLGGYQTYFERLLRSESEIRIYPDKDSIPAGEVRFDWMKNRKALAYHFALFSIEESNKNNSEVVQEPKLVTEDSTLIINHYEVGNLPPSAKYFWRVRNKTGNGWSVWSRDYEFSTLGINSVKFNSFEADDLQAWPNPAESVVNMILPVSHSAQGRMTAEIYNSAGSLCRQINSVLQATGHFSISLEGFSPGQYNVIIRDGCKIYKAVFIRE